MPGWLPLCGSTLLPPWDPLLVYLTFNSISPGFILRTIGSCGGEAVSVRRTDSP